MKAWEKFKDSCEVIKILNGEDAQREIISAELLGTNSDGTQIIASYDSDENSIYLDDQAFNSTDVALSAVRRELENMYGDASLSYERGLSASQVFEDSDSSDSVDVRKKSKMYN